MDQNARVERTAVLVVGGGPIGLCLAADLGRRGIPCVLVEQGDGKVGPAKMLQVSVRTLEFCRQLGITDRVKNWGFPSDFPLDNVFVTGLNGYELARVRMSSMGSTKPSRFSPEYQCHCPQTYFDPALRELAQSYPSTTLRYHSRLESFLQDENAVIATVRDTETGRHETIEAAYLVGCDGYGSTVRESLGIQMRGQTVLDHSINVEFRTANLNALHDKGNAIRYIGVGLEGTWCTLVAIDGREVWRLTLYGANDAEVKKLDVGASIRRIVGRDLDYEITSVGKWVRRAVVADRFQDGRVFLAGDAAHTHPPNGGYGMNTGIADAMDLGWKLTAVVEGWGGPRLLDSYDVERRPVCHRAVNESLSDYHRLTANTRYGAIGDPGPAGERARHEFGEHLRLANAKAKSWQPFGIHLGYVYDPSPIVVDDGTPRPPDDTIDYSPTSRPGSRAPHAWLPDGRSVLDLFGRNYVLLRFGRLPVDITPLKRAAVRRGMKIDVHDINDRNIADLYERKLVLVRPDGHVAWRADSVPADPYAIVDRVRGVGLRAAARVSIGATVTARAAE